MKKPVILSIETATDCCSVTLSAEHDILCTMGTTTPRAQAAMLSVLINETFKTARIAPGQCDAVAVSSGPGSYTGLRVGVSTAKGLCFGIGKPLIPIGTLEILKNAGIEYCKYEKNANFIIPMIDARRMEVYSAVYDSKGEEITGAEPVILDESSFLGYLEKGKVLFTGNGASKFRSIQNHPNALFYPCAPDAVNMVNLSVEAFKNGNFADVAYFEPFYLKDFTPGTSKKNILDKG